MYTKKWVSSLIFYIPALIAGIQAHSIQESGVALFLFAIAFTAAPLFFIRKASFPKGYWSFFKPL